MSVATRQLSSTITGIREARATAANPSRSVATNGCSSTVTPNSSSTGNILMACFRVHPQLASTRSSRSVTSRIALRISRSLSSPSLILRTGYCSASMTFFLIISAVSIPMVKVEIGAFAASSPQSFHSGTPSRLPTRSWSAVDSAARAELLPTITRSKARSAPSSSNAFWGIAVAYTSNAARTVSQVSP
jgi:hypothetical protein